MQQKRQENQQNDEDTIQKAIDEMYAQQAKQYIGESSLDGAQNKISDTDYSTKSSGEDATDEHDTTDQIDTSQYNYQEINLDNISNVHNINDSDDVSNTNENQTENVETASNLTESSTNHANDETNLSQDIDHADIDNHLHHHDENSNGTIDNTGISEATYREISDNQKDTTQNTVDLTQQTNNNERKRHKVKMMMY